MALFPALKQQQHLFYLCVFDGIYLQLLKQQQRQQHLLPPMQ